MRYFTFCFLFSWPGEGGHFQLVFERKRFCVISYSFLRLGLPLWLGYTGCLEVPGWRRVAFLRRTRLPGPDAKRLHPAGIQPSLNYNN